MLKNKNKYNKDKQINVIILVVSTLVLLALYFNMNNCKKLDCITFTQKDTYVLKETFLDKSGSFLAEYKSDDSTLRVEIIDQSSDESEDLIQSRVTRIQAQYEDNISPYPGEISDLLSCPDGFKPEIIKFDQNGLIITSFQVKLNERMVTGQCDENQVVFNSYNHYFYCPKLSKTFLLEFIFDKHFNIESPIEIFCEN
jgi:hypothetical protein